MRVTGPRSVELEAERARVINAVSPTAKVEANEDGALITVHDLNGTTTAQINHGATGPQGPQGPTGPAGSDGRDGTDGQNGQDGQDGQDGVSPSVTVTEITGGHRVTITDADGAHVFDVLDGADGEDGQDGSDGQDGQDGAPGVGVPAGGTDGQMLVKDGATDYATKWANQPSVPVTDVQVNGTSVLSSGVANVPRASGSSLGVVYVSGGGLAIDGSTGRITTQRATDAEVKAGTNGQKPIVPIAQDASAFYGLAKAAGDTTQSQSSNGVGTYTDSAIDKILAMLGVSALIGPTESGTASQAYEIGEAFLYGGKLYKATSAIAQSDAIVPGTNCTQTTIIDLLKGA